MLHQNLKKAKELRDLENKILDLSTDFDLKVFIQLYQDFFDGVKNLKDENLGLSSIPISTTNHEEEELLEYLQYLLIEEGFEELSNKKTKLFASSIIKHKPDFSFERVKKDFDVYLDEIYDMLQEDIKDDLDNLTAINTKFDDTGLNDDLMWDVLYSWFGPYCYVDDLRRVGTLILKTDKLPEHFDRITSTIKNSFAFQQHLAVAVMCRAALEVALRDLYKKLGFTTKRTPENNLAKGHFDKIRRVTGKTYPNQFNPEPRDLRQLICKLEEYQKYEDDLDKLYGDLSRVAHGTNVINKAKSQEYIKETYWLIHEMYSEIRD